MESNFKEVAHLASTASSSNFDREGALQVWEETSHGKGTRKAFREKWFLLRGNLLFYFANAEKESALGLLVLERVTARVAPSQDSAIFAFDLVFENDDQPVSLASPTAEDRDAWIEAINTAGYEYTKKLILQLRDELMNKMGHFLPNLALSVPIDSDRKYKGINSEEEFFEISLRCNGLSLGPDGEEPNTMIIVSSSPPGKETGEELTRTEIERNTCNPFFMKTLCFSSGLISGDTPIMLEAKDIAEGVTRRDLGRATFTMDALTGAPDDTITCSLGEGNGTVTISSWQDDSDSGSLQSAERTCLENGIGLIPNGTAHHNAEAQESAHTNHPHSRTHVKDHVKQLSVWFGDMTTRAFRFPAEDGSEINVHEFLGESKLTYYLPQKVITIYRDEDELMVRRLEDIGRLPKVWESVRADHLEQFRKSLKLYNARLKYIEEYEGPPFVSGQNMKRLIRETEFLPTNLHQQRMDVTSSKKPNGVYYDTTTCGTFTAFTLRYRQGGIRRLKEQFREQFASKFNSEPRVEELWYLLTYINKLQKDIYSEAEVLGTHAVERKTSELKSVANRFFLKIRQLLHFCDQSLVQESLENISSLKIEDKNGTKKKKRRNSLQNILNFKKYRRRSSIDENMNPTVDSWVMLRSSLETLRNDFDSKIDKMMAKRNGKGTLSAEAEQLTNGILVPVEEVCRAVLNALAFKIAVESSPNVALWHTIRLRRNLCYCQGLSSLTVGVMSGISSSIRNPVILEQISALGILISFESLLSTFGDEIAMLEDMLSIVLELNDVKFRIFCSESDGTNMPRVCQFRPSVIMEIPLPPHEFDLLPAELREGHLIDIHTTIFNVGINEQATLGERLGVDGMQNDINAYGYESLSRYIEEFLKMYPEPAKEETGQSLSDLMTQLKQSMASKKSRNAEILHLSDEIARMVRAFRYTCCKSSRDRTSMGITLEEVMILQREHGLARRMFMKTLDCLRTDGVRRANAIKCTGKRHYDFSTMRVMALPKLYKPPSGCYRPI